MLYQIFTSNCSAWYRCLFVMENPLTAPSYQLWLQKDSTVLVVSDGGAVTYYDSFRWVLGTDVRGYR
jgi:hypothetical protein